MTTARTIITDAYLTCLLLGQGEPLDDFDAQSALRRLNGMLDSWATDNLYAKRRVEYVNTVPAGTSFTVGPTGNVVTASVPVRLEEGCFTRSNNIDHPLILITSDEYDRIPYKTAAAPWANVMYYASGITTGTCSVYPAMSAPAEIHLQVLEPLGAFATLDTNVELPKGYLDAIMYSMCEIVCLGKRPVPADIAKHAARARARIRGANVEVPVMQLNVPGQWYPYRGGLVL